MGRPRVTAVLHCPGMAPERHVVVLRDGSTVADVTANVQTRSPCDAAGALSTLRLGCVDGPLVSGADLAADALRDGDWVHVIPVEGFTPPLSEHSQVSKSQFVVDTTTARLLTKPPPVAGRGAAWVSATPRCYQKLTGHYDDVHGLAALGNDFVASCSYDKTVRVWDIAAGRCAFSLEDSSRPVSTVATLGRDRLAYDCDGYNVKIWDLASRSCECTLEGHEGLVLGLTALAPGRLASCSEDRTVRVWDVDGGRRLATVAGHKDEVFGIAALHGGDRLASCSLDGAVKVWDITRGECAVDLAGHGDEAYAVASLGDDCNGLLASCSLDQTIRVWDIRSTECVRCLKDEGSVYCIAPLGAGVLASGSFCKVLRLWDVGTGLCLCTIEAHTAGVKAVVRLSSCRLATGSYDRSVKVWSAERS